MKLNKQIHIYIYMTNMDTCIIYPYVYIYNIHIYKYIIERYNDVYYMYMCKGQIAISGWLRGKSRKSPGEEIPESESPR